MRLPLPTTLLAPTPLRAGAAATFVAALSAIALAAAATAPFASVDAAAWAMTVSWLAGGLAAVVALAAQLRAMPRHLRRAWAPFLAAAVCFVLGVAVWFALLLFDASLVFPSIADVLWLAMAPLLVIGVFRLAAPSAGHGGVAALDVVALVAAGGALGIVVCADAANTSTVGALATVVATAYSALFFAAAAAIVHAFVTRLQAREHADVAVLVVGFALLGTAFGVYGNDLLRGTYVAGTEWYDPVWTLGMLSFVLAPRLAFRKRVEHRSGSERELRARAVVPSLAATAVLAALISEVALAPTDRAWPQLVLVVALVVVMLVFSLRYRLLSAEHAELLAREHDARREAEEEREQQKRFFDLAPEPLVVLDPSGHVIRASGRFPSSVGEPSGDALVGRRFVEFFDARDQAQVAAMLASVDRSEETVELEAQIATGEGLRWIHWNATRDDEHGLVYVAGQDVTERRQAEISLRESEERFSELVNTIPEVFFLLDPAGGGEMLYISPPCERVFGRTPESMCTRSEWADVIHPDDRAETLARAAVVDEGATAVYEYRVVHADGSVRWIHETKSPIFDESGRVVRHAGIAVDITERRELERRLLHSQKLDAVGQLAGGVAHDFNNILTAIVGYAEIARTSDAAGDPDVAESLDQILSGAGRAGALTQRLLSFARREVVRPEVLDVNDVVRDMASFMRRMIGEQIELVVDLPREPLATKIDRTQLEQVLMNLAVNARDAMPGGGTLAIGADHVGIRDGDAETAHLEPGRYCRLRVTDNGTGVDPAVVDRIFEPFFTTKRAGEGTGLGLATVYGIVEQAGGTVTVTTERGEGTTFTVLLPVSDEAIQSAAAASAPAQPHTGTARILLVDDNDAVRDVAATALRRDGYDVCIAAESAPVLADSAQFSGFDLLLTDIVMPEVDGPTLARALQQHSPELRVLFMSGFFGTADDGGSPLPAGASLLRKPFSLDDLRAAVRETLESRAAA